MPENAVPLKKDPKDYPLEVEKLSAFSAFIEANRASIGAKAADDALKVIRCLCFVKINQEFIEYAVAHPQDARVYTHSRDKRLHLLRDTQNLAFHFTDYKEDQAEACFADFNNIVRQIEEVFDIGTAQNCLAQCVKNFYWDEDVGCLEARTAAVIRFVAQIQSSPIRDINQLIEMYGQKAKTELQGSLEDTEENYYRLIFHYFSSNHYFGQPVLNKQGDGKEDVVILTRPLLAQLLQKIDLCDPIASSIVLPKVIRTAEDVLRKIEFQECVIQNVALEKSLDFVFKQLTNPSEERPLKPVTEDDGRRFNPKMQQWEKKKNGTTRSTDKKGTDFPKKWATSLPPADFSMDVFPVGHESLVLLYDLTYCDTKGEKYAWPRNVGSNPLKKKRWEDAPFSVGLETLRQININRRESGEVSENNEVNLAPSLPAFMGAAAKADTYEARIAALEGKWHIHQEYGIDTLLFISSPRAPRDNKRIWEYTFKQQLADIARYAAAHGNQCADLKSKEAQLIQYYYDKYITEVSIVSMDIEIFYSYLEWILSLKKSIRDQFLAQEGIQNKLRELLDEKSEGNTLLHRLMQADHDYIHLVEFLIKEKNLRIDEVNERGDTALHEACRYRRNKTAQLLIAEGASLKVNNKAGKTPTQMLQATPHEMNQARIKNYAQDMIYLTRAILMAAAVVGLISAMIAAAPSIAVGTLLLIGAIGGIAALCLIAFVPAAVFLGAIVALAITYRAHKDAVDNFMNKKIKEPIIKFFSFCIQKVVEQNISNRISAFLARSSLQLYGIYIQLKEKRMHKKQEAAFPANALFTSASVIKSMSNEGAYYSPLNLKENAWGDLGEISQEEPPEDSESASLLQQERGEIQPSMDATSFRNHSPR